MNNEHILVVDDDELVRTGLALDLESEGYTITTANSAEEALKCLEEQPVHLILSDLMMADMDGLNLLEHVRERMKGVGFIMITGHGSVDRALEAMRCGANDFVQKPANPELIRQRVRAVLDELRLQRSLIDERQKERNRQQAIQKKYLREQRMISLGRLAGGVAEYLAGVLDPLFVHFGAQTDGEGQGEDPLTQATRKAQSFIRDLEIIGHSEPEHSQPVHLDRIVAPLFAPEGLQTFRRYAPHVMVKTSFTAELPAVNGCATQLEVMVRNLISHSIEGMPDGGLLEIRLSIGDPEDSPDDAAPQNHATEYVLLEVRDTSPEPPATDMDLLFEPFQTRKIAGHTCSTGLGLSVVYRIVQEHHGIIQVDNKPRHGTGYRIYLPTTKESRLGEAPVAPHLTGHETVLVLDDRESDREEAAAILEKLGYQVLRAASGKEAVGLFQHALASGADLHIDLAIIDLVLGDACDGVQAYQQILAIQPNQKAILASGFADYSRVAEARKLGMRRCIQKPYRADVLAKSVRTELDQRESGPDGP